MNTLTLDKLVRELLIESGETTLHKFPRYLQLGISGLREFNLDVSGIPKIVELDILDNDLANLPHDFIEHIKIAICDDNGNLHSLGVNRNLCFPLKTDICGDLLANGGAPNSGIITNFEGGNFRNLENIGRRFGAGGGGNPHGFYRINKTRGYIAFQGFAGDTVTLEYLADVEKNEDGKFEVHPFLVEAIKNWIIWKIMARNVRASGSKTREVKADFRASKKIATKRMKTFTVEEALQTIRRTFTPSPKM